MFTVSYFTTGRAKRERLRGEEAMVFTFSPIREQLD